MLRAGQLRERITIEQVHISDDDSGGMVRTCTVLADNVPAGRRDISGSEKPATGIAGGEVSTARVEFTLHWRPGITSLMRVRHGEEFFNIRHVNDVARRRQTLILTCDTGVNDG